MNSIPEDNERSVWITRSKVQDEAGLVCEVNHSRLRYYGKSSGIPVDFCVALAKDNDGNLWMGGNTGIVKVQTSLIDRDSSSKFRGVRGITDVMAIAVLNFGSAWIGVDTPGRGGRLQQFDHAAWFVQAKTWSEFAS